MADSMLFDSKMALEREIDRLLNYPEDRTFVRAALEKIDINVPAQDGLAHWCQEKGVRHRNVIELYLNVWGGIDTSSEYGSAKISERRESRVTLRTLVVGEGD